MGDLASEQARNRAMAHWDGEAAEEEFEYFWDGLDNVGWDFDALNEDGLDWDEWNRRLPPSRSDRPPEVHPPSYQRASSPSSAPAESAAVWNSPSSPFLTRRRSPTPHLPATPPLRPITDSFATSPSSAAARPRGNRSLADPPGRTSRAGPSGGNVRDFIRQSRQLHQLPRQPRPDSPAYTAENSTHHSRSPTTNRLPSASPSNPASSSFDGVDIDDLLVSDADSSANSMPSTTRSRRRGSQGVVDLTDEGESSTNLRRRAARKRSVPAEEAGSERDFKRPRASQSGRALAASSTNAIEEVDLTTDNPSTEEQLRRKQQESLLATQQSSLSDTASGPLRIGKRQCIICMEAYTDITVTHCGHVYCHECLTQALRAGEKNNAGQVGNCPVCRKTVSRKKVHHIIPVSFMKKATFKGKARWNGAVWA